jgi:glutamate racemase
VEEIRSFAMEIAGWLVERDVKMLVIACNSVEVSAIGDIAAAHDVPVIGVVNPGARAAISATRNGMVGVIGTEATIATGAYQRALGASVQLHAVACPVFVEHVERGDATSPGLREAARGYLAPLKEAGIDTLILGCTHYPLLSGLIQMEMGPDVVLVSSAEETAKDVYAALSRSDALRTEAEAPSHGFLTTGERGSFRDLAERFLGHEVEVDTVHVGSGA